jgi:hypothetical protein
MWVMRILAERYQLIENEFQFAIVHGSEIVDVIRALCRTAQQRRKERGAWVIN